MSTVACVSVTGCQAGLDLLERLAVGRHELPTSLPRLHTDTGASGIAVLSTCQRVELYATSPGPLDPARLVGALAADRGVPAAVLTAAAAVRTGPDAVRHLLRVTSGLASFVLGEREIVGQVRAAAEASRAAGVASQELDRLLAAAVSASRRVHRETCFAAAGGSVASAAVDAAAARWGGDLAECRVVVVGAGEVATVAVRRAAGLGASVTVANRTMRQAEQLRNAGAHVVDLADLDARLAGADVAVLATAAPHPLVDAESLGSARRAGAQPLLLLDLSMPRNVDPGVRCLEAVELLDLEDLRREAASAADALLADVGTAERLVEQETARYLHWLGTRSAHEPVRRLRADAERAAGEEASRAARRLPPELQPVVEDALLRLARRLAHGPTTRVLAAARDGDDDLVDLLSGMFSATPAVPEATVPQAAVPEAADPFVPEPAVTEPTPAVDLPAELAGRRAS